MPVGIGTRVCDCGCGEAFEPRRFWQRYKNVEHQQRYWKGLRDEAARIHAEKIKAQHGA